MKASDYHRISNLPEDQRKEIIEEEKKKVFAEGTKAASTLSYLKEYLDNEYAAHYIAFEALPIEATIDQYRTVHHSLIATRRLEDTLKAKIKAVENLTSQIDEGDLEYLKKVNV